MAARALPSIPSFEVTKLPEAPFKFFTDYIKMAIELFHGQDHNCTYLLRYTKQPTPPWASGGGRWPKDSKPDPSLL